MASQGLPPVSRCAAKECFYNRESACHAPAINVGGDHPACDTYISNSHHIAGGGNGMVGACHVSHCKWNRELTCSARAITVDHHGSHADCATFEPT